MGFWGKLGKGLLKAAPVAAAFIPGVGPLAAMGIGAATGALSKKLEGGSWKQALGSGAIGAATGALGAASKGGGFLSKLGGKLGQGAASRMGQASPDVMGRVNAVGSQFGRSPSGGGGFLSALGRGANMASKAGKLSKFNSGMGGMLGTNRQPYSMPYRRPYGMPSNPYGGTPPYIPEYGNNTRVFNRPMTRMRYNG